MESQVLQRISTDRIEQFLTDAESEIARIRAIQMTALLELDRRQIPTADGCRSLREWTASRLDLAPETAGSLVSTARRLVEKPRLGAALEAGEITFDRAAAAAGDSSDDAHLHLDVAAVRRRHRSMLSRDAERGLLTSDYIAIQPTLDGDAGRLHGSLSGVRFRTVEKALDDRGDQYRKLPDGRVLSRSVRNAHALVAMAQDSLDMAGDDAVDVQGSQVTVFVDATREAPVAQVEYGPRIGPAALEAMLCTGSVQVIGIEGGRPVVATDSTKAIPPAIRRFVALRDDGCCADGCTSRYRLQPHHVIPRSEGGGNDPDNLRTMCWFHHHVVIHGYGFSIDPDSPVGRSRFRQPPLWRGPP